MTYAEHADPVSFAVCAGVRISASCILELTQSLVVVLRASSVHTRETHVMIGNVYNKITQCTSFPLMDGCEDYPAAQTQSPDPKPRPKRIQTQWAASSFAFSARPPCSMYALL